MAAQEYEAPRVEVVGSVAELTLESGSEFDSPAGSN